MKNVFTSALAFHMPAELSWPYTGKEDDPYMKNSDGSCAKREVTEA
jgi:hypothetical protein